MDRSRWPVMGRIGLNAMRAVGLRRRPITRSRSAVGGLGLMLRVGVGRRCGPMARLGRMRELSRGRLRVLHRGIVALRGAARAGSMGALFGWIA